MCYMLLKCLFYREHNQVPEATEGKVHGFGASQPVQGTDRESSVGTPVSTLKHNFVIRIRPCKLFFVSCDVQQHSQDTQCKM